MHFSSGKTLKPLDALLMKLHLRGFNIIYELSYLIITLIINARNIANKVILVAAILVAKQNWLGFNFCLFLAYSCTTDIVVAIRKGPFSGPLSYMILILRNKDNAIRDACTTFKTLGCNYCYS